jgi:hypothetical protein
MPSTDTATVTKTEATAEAPDRSHVNALPKVAHVPHLPSSPLAFTDAQLNQIMRCAEPLHPRVRIAFIEAVARALRGQELGDGVVFRVCRQVLRDSTMFDPPELSGGHVSKWSR